MRRAGSGTLILLLGTLGIGTGIAPQESRDEFLAARLRILAIEDRRPAERADLQPLLELARTARAESPGELQLQAIRTLGRLERADLIPDLLALVDHASADVRSEAAIALALSLRAEARRQSGGPEVSEAIGALLRAESVPSPVLGVLPYTSAAQVQAAERILRTRLASDPPRGADARGLEMLARLHRKLSPLNAETIELLRQVATGRRGGDDPVRRNAAAALVSAAAMDLATVEAVLQDRDDEVRRLAALALASDGQPFEAAGARALVMQALDDPSPLVRYEGVRAWARGQSGANGCGLLVDRFADRNLHVALAAIDALGELCTSDAALTRRIVAEARLPPQRGAWHRAAHAIVALSRRSPDRVQAFLTQFAGSPVWQIRMYTARAAAHAGNTSVLERLASDPHHNVREAALLPLRKLAGERSLPTLESALEGSDYQLLRTAAMALEGLAPGEHTADAIGAALQRVTAERKETSRDTRLALIERLQEMGRVSNATVLEPLTRDFDPRIAQAAADTLRQLTGKSMTARPQPLERPALPDARDLGQRLIARVELEGGSSFVLALNNDNAPLAVTRFVRLAGRGYYDGLTFHRVVANFVIQGGSPGANEYAGDGPFMRDELGQAPHSRGTVGISTRGHHTGDAQIFVNLVDNPRLDFDYTVFAQVRPADLPVVDGIQEGARITRVTILPERTP